MDSNQDVNSVNEELTMAYIAGMLDSSGSMSATITKVDDYKLGYDIEAEVAISRTQPFGMQKLDEFCIKNGINSTVNKRDGRYLLSITQNRSIIRFLDMIGPYLLDRRREAELLQSEIAPALEAGQHLSDKVGFVKVVSMVEELRKMNTRGKESKYSAEYFQEKWEL